jgi:dihydroneopterin aldolase
MQITHDRIVLNGMQFFGRHGTIAAEQELGQRFTVDIAVSLDLRAAGLSDDLNATVNYALIHDRAREVISGPAVQLTETLAERIAGLVLQDHPQIQRVEVRVGKPNVRLGDTVLAGSAVEIVRQR